MADRVQPYDNGNSSMYKKMYSCTIDVTDRMILIIVVLQAFDGIMIEI